MKKFGQFLGIWKIAKLITYGWPVFFLISWVWLVLQHINCCWLIPFDAKSDFLASNFIVSGNYTYFIVIIC